MTNDSLNRKPQKQSNEQRYYDALHKIARRFKKSHQITGEDVGLEPQEELEFAYDNIQWEAEHAIKGKRRPKV